MMLTTFTYLDLNFTEDQLRFLFLKLFAVSNDTEKYEYESIFQIFGSSSPQIQQKKSMKNYKSKILSVSQIEHWLYLIVAIIVHFS